MILLETALGHFLDMVHECKFCFPYPARGKELQANAPNIPGKRNGAPFTCETALVMYCGSPCYLKRLFPALRLPGQPHLFSDELNEDQPPPRAFLPSLFLTGRMEW